MGYYIATSIVVGQITPTIIKAIREMLLRNRWITMTINLAGAVPGWAVIAWGAHMVSECKTCQVTNPGLYYPAKYFIFGQIMLLMLTTLFFSVGFSSVLTFMSTLRQKHRLG